MAPRWNVVWITGASSGIGRELALKLADRGSLVAVSARSADKLAELASLNPNIRAYPLDVTNAQAASAVAARIEHDLGPISLVILNAGVWDLMSATDFSLGTARKSFEVNYFGVVNALEPVMKSMLARKDGHIAVVSSVAGYRGGGAAYSPTKAALISLSEALYPQLKDNGVKLTLICPGFIDTPMTEGKPVPMPFRVGVVQAADTIIGGLERNKYEIAFPWQMAALMKFMRIAPNWLFLFIAGRTMRRIQAAQALAASGDGARVER